MSREKKKQLANEAVKLINEFREEMAILGYNPLVSVSIADDYNTINVEDENTGVTGYNLAEISEVFKYEIEGIGPCSSAFYEGFDLAKNEAEYEYKKMSKQEFINYVGGMFYAECRCEEIYERLKQIDVEASEIATIK